MPYTSELLQQAWVGNLTTLRHFHIVTGLSPQQAASVCGVSSETYRHWRRDRTPNLAAVRLLAVIGGYLPWQGWEGWEMHNGFLFPPGYTRHGIRPGDILALPFTLQLLSEYRRRIESESSSLPVTGQVIRRAFGDGIK